MPTKPVEGQSGKEVLIPLNKLKKSSRNARKTPHSEAAIEACAASIAAKGILQNLVVEPEFDGEEQPPVVIWSPSARAGGSPSCCG